MSRPDLCAHMAYGYRCHAPREEHGHLFANPKHDFVAPEPPALAGKVERLHEVDGCGALGFWARGHHDPDEFAEAVEWEYGDVIAFSAVEHKWWRNVPWEGGVGTLFVDADGPGRGAYPVTVYEASLREEGAA